MHVQEEQYEWDKMIERERAKGRRFVYDAVDRMTIELGVLGITTIWQCEGLRMQDFWASLPMPRLFIDGVFNSDDKEDA